MQGEGEWHPVGRLGRGSLPRISLFADGQQCYARNRKRLVRQANPCWIVPSSRAFEAAIFNSGTAFTGTMKFLSNALPTGAQGAKGREIQAGQRDASGRGPTRWRSMQN